MIRKLLVVAFIVTAALSITGCWEELFGYRCEGLGTCSDPKFCCDDDSYATDCYYVADGQTFYCGYYSCSDAWDDMYDYCYY